MFGPGITTDSNQSMAKVIKEISCFWSKGAGSFNAIGLKWYALESCSYLMDFLSSAREATLPTPKQATCSYDLAKVSGTVTSQTKERPHFQGVMVIPSQVVYHQIC